MNRSTLDELYGNQKVCIKLSAIYETLQFLESGDVAGAIALLRTMAAVEDRKQLRRVREEIYRRLRHAQQIGDTAEMVAMQQLLAQCDDARRTLTA